MTPSSIPGGDTDSVGVASGKASGVKKEIKKSANSDMRRYLLWETPCGRLLVGKRTAKSGLYFSNNQKKAKNPLINDSIESLMTFVRSLL